MMDAMNSFVQMFPDEKRNANEHDNLLWPQVGKRKSYQPNSISIKLDKCRL